MPKVEIGTIFLPGYQILLPICVLSNWERILLRSHDSKNSPKKNILLDVIFHLLLSNYKEPICTSYSRKENKAAVPPLPPPSQYKKKKKKKRKQHEFHVMARVYSFLTFHLMPAKLIPWFQQAEYILHHLQLNFTCTRTSCRHALQQIEESIWCQQKSHCEGSWGWIAGRAWPRAWPRAWAGPWLHSGQMAVTSLRLPPQS